MNKFINNERFGTNKFSFKEALYEILKEENYLWRESIDNLVDRVEKLEDIIKVLTMMMITEDKEKEFLQKISIGWEKL